MPVVVLEMIRKWNSRTSRVPLRHGMFLRMTNTDRVWNRARDTVLEPGKPGDRALYALLRVHRLIMNGGLFHGIAVPDPDELNGAIKGYWYFGLGEPAKLLLRAQRVPPPEWAAMEEAFNRDYARVADDALLLKAFETHYLKNPGAYDPVD